MKLLIIDSGHNEYVQGKESPDKSLREWEFNNDMQYKLKKRAEEHGLTVYLTNPNPSKKDEIGLTKRTELANEYWKSKGKPETLFVSLHANAYGSGFNDARGIETYVANNSSQNSKNAAKYVQEALYKMLKSLDTNSKDRGVKSENFTVIYKTSMPSILIEYAFYTNKDDLKILKNYREKLIEATIQGLCKYFNIDYKQVEENKPIIPTFEQCIVYSGEIDKTIAQILGWGLSNSTLIDISSYKEGIGKKILVVGSASQKLKGDIAFYGIDRWETLKLVLKYLNK
ncbi:N-acetylmuramoyl-L-alanine amidase family protein [Romboutsia sp.]|uniref:N-acetylmuramoyl-L-alanine amidase family protein n=1 Tax=Romboutsia sp. TaxID=1965302 RepID=UPI003F2AA1F1